jgi:membrane protease YdiL (CAAX protease family)
MEFLLSGVLSLASVVYYLRVARESEGESRSRAVLQPYGTPDAVFATILVVWFLTNIIGSANRVLVVNTQLLIVGAIFSFLLLVFLLCFLVLRGRNPVDLFGLRGIPWAVNLRAACYGLVAALPAIYFVHSLSFHFSGTEAQPQPLLQFLAEHAGLHDRLLLVLTAIVIAPISEELIFRGYIFGVLRRYAGRWWALVISASVFAAIHAHIPSLAGLFVLAVALTLVYEGTGSLWASILMHALFNSITVILTLAWPESLK